MPTKEELANEFLKNVMGITPKKNEHDHVQCLMTGIMKAIEAAKLEFEGNNAEWPGPKRLRAFVCIVEDGHPETWSATSWPAPSDEQTARMAEALRRHGHGPPEDPLVSADPTRPLDATSA